MTQGSIVVSQFFNSFSVRTDRESVTKMGLLSNPALLGAGLIGLGFLASVSYLPFLQGVFNTAALSVTDWLMLWGFGLALLVADEIRKALSRQRESSRQRRVSRDPTREES
jgi:magnesium-transporting ATPase (P-type)